MANNTQVNEFIGRLAAGQYANATAAKRAIGRTNGVDDATKAKIREAIASHFDDGVSPAAVEVKIPKTRAGKSAAPVQTAAVPKRRGRPPKNATALAVTTPAPAPAALAPRKKAAAALAPATVAPKVPAKRGRKPGAAKALALSNPGPTSKPTPEQGSDMLRALSDLLKALPEQTRTGLRLDPGMITPLVKDALHFAHAAVKQEEVQEKPEPVQTIAKATSAATFSPEEKVYVEKAYVGKEEDEEEEEDNHVKTTSSSVFTSSFDS